MEDFELSAAGFEHYARADRTHGVYCLLAEGEVVYVGQSKAIHYRIASHINARDGRRALFRSSSLGDASQWKIWFDEVYVLWCEPHERERLELEWIDHFKPRYNIQVREPLPKMKVNIAELAKRAGVKLCADPPTNSSASLLKTVRR
jgi:excinuclease UvrABC nuclease subunit